VPERKASSGTILDFGLPAIPVRHPAGGSGLGRSPFQLFSY